MQNNGLFQAFTFAESPENHRVSPLRDDSNLNNPSVLNFDQEILAESHKFECPFIYRDLRGPIKTKNKMKFRQFFGLASRPNNTTEDSAKNNPMLQNFTGKFFSLLPTAFRMNKIPISKVL